jgi:hypothetical protein
MKKAMQTVINIANLTFVIKKLLVENEENAFAKYIKQHRTKPGGGT